MNNKNSQESTGGEAVAGAERLDHIRHSLAHLLAAAVLKEFPDAKLGVGPTVENGFYYDFLLPRAITPDDLKTLEKTMRGFVNKKLAFTGREVSADEARALFAAQPFKLDLINDFTGKGQAGKQQEKLTVYETGVGAGQDGTAIFTDLCRGGHVENTAEIPADGFTLDKIAGAYWKGDEKNQQLQRIYGLAFESKEKLKEYETLIEEAKKRDHRKLGKDLQLFTIIDEIGGGLPLFYPKGAIVRRLLENYISELQEKKGYVPIWIPHITKGELYKISGHLDKYDAMYPPMDLKDEAQYYLKPMNCPHFMMLYKSLPHSYRELPVRYVSTTTVYRYEKSGELSGLTRVRALTQDDCHVFARPDQIETEIGLMLDMIAEIYRTFGFDDFRVRISVRDPKHPEHYIGDENVWKESEATLKKLIEGRNWRHEVGEGEAAFYGPKLDFIFKDAIGRDWQLSTIQLDMNLPHRFQLEYIDDASQKKEPIVIHRAMLGSTERFMGIIIEHFAGKFPVWLAPTQATILPVSEKFADYGNKVREALVAAGIRTEFGEANESLGKRIREAEMMKVPYLLVVGEKEETGNTVNVRDRKGEEKEMPLAEFMEKIKKEAREKTL